MLELFFMAFFGGSTDTLVPQPTALDLPQIEILMPTALPQKKTKKIAPKLLEDPKLSVLAVDITAQKRLFSQRANKTQHIASLTKLMTYLIITEENDPNEVVTIPLEATKAIGAKIDLYANERLTVESLLEAILIPSANDAAIALAIHNAGTEDAFVKKMNQRATAMGLPSAQFYNATGLDIYDEETDILEGNQMSATDLLKLVQYLLQDDFFRKTVKKGNFYRTSIDGQFLHEKASTNQLWGSFINTKGIKTGYTPLAGQCFINLSEVDHGNEVVTIVLGSSDRFTETKNLIDWITGAYVWQ